MPTLFELKIKEKQIKNQTLLIQNDCKFLKININLHKIIATKMSLKIKRRM